MKFHSSDTAYVYSGSEECLGKILAKNGVREKVKKAIREKEKVGCTGCMYCMPCPQHIKIREKLKAMNSKQISFDLTVIICYDNKRWRKCICTCGEGKAYIILSGFGTEEFCR